MKHRIAALAASTALLALLVPSAFAADISRDEYKASVEPICKANTKTIQKTLKGVERGVRKNKLKAQSRKLARAGKQMKRTYNKLKGKPQPSADEGKLRKWLRYIKQEADLFTKLSKQAKKNQKGAFSSTRSKMDKIANKANVEVLSFSFKDCKVDPSALT